MPANISIANNFESGCSRFSTRLRHADAAEQVERVIIRGSSRGFRFASRRRLTVTRIAKREHRATPLNRAHGIRSERSSRIEKHYFSVETRRTNAGYARQNCSTEGSLTNTKSHLSPRFPINLSIYRSHECLSVSHGCAAGRHREFCFVS